MYTDLKPLLQGRLKQKGMTYKDLGRAIGLSEAGVKKLFQAKDCSLGRLREIAKALDLDLSELVASVETPASMHVVEIDEKTQSYLEKHPQLMDVFWLVLVEDVTPDEIMERFRISRASLYRHLGDLDRRGLVKWKAGDQIEVPNRGSFLLKPKGPVIRRWIKKFADSIIEDLAMGQDPKRGEESYFAQRFFYLTPASLRELERRLAEVNAEFDAISRRERKLPRKQTMPVRCFTTFATGSTVKSL